MEFVSSSFFKWRLVGSLFLLLALAACQGEEIPLTRFEDSPIIDSLLASAQHFVVNTDIEAERWVAKTRLGLPTDSLIIGGPSNMIAIGDTVYISDQQSENIFAVGADGYLSRKIGGPGEGPGEFTYLRELHYNGSHVFASELGGRIQVFTEKFDYASSFSSVDFGPWGKFAVSPDYMLLGCSRDSNWLICTRTTFPPFARLESKQLLPRLDLPNQSGENSNAVTISPDGGRIAVAYKGLPYIFVYDDQFRHLRTIRFEGSDVRDFEPIAGAPPAAAGVELPAGTEPGTRAFIATIKFINSRYLVVRVVPRTNYIFDLSENDYSLAKKLIFLPMNDTEEEEGIASEDFLLHGDYLYVSSPWEEYVFGYEFDVE